METENLKKTVSDLKRLQKKLKRRKGAKCQEDSVVLQNTIKQLSSSMPNIGHKCKSTFTLGNSNVVFECIREEQHEGAHWDLAAAKEGSGWWVQWWEDITKRPEISTIFVSNK